MYELYVWVQEMDSDNYKLILVLGKNKMNYKDLVQDQAAALIQLQNKDFSGDFEISFWIKNFQN